MAPAFEPGTPPCHVPSLWDLVDSLFKHPGLLFGASTIILGIFAANGLKHSTRRRHERWDPIAFGSTSTDEKHNHVPSSLSDLPPPLRSVLTHDSLAEGLSQSQQQLIPSDPLPYQRQYAPSDPALSPTVPSKPWRRHSFPSPLDTDSPTTEIMSDHTSYYPIFDDNGVRQPGRWRRRTLVFEMLPAVDQNQHTVLENDPVLHDVLNGVGTDTASTRDTEYADLPSGASKQPRSDFGILASAH